MKDKDVFVAAANEKDPDIYMFPTLRDQFAMAALSGIMANHEWHNSNQHHVADDAYKIADAMLERRQKP